MRKLTKQHLADRDKIHKALFDAKDNVEDAITDFNKVVDEAYSQYEQAVEKLNGLLQEARDFIEDICNEQQTYIDDKSEKWQDGEAGQQYREWRDEVESLTKDLEDVELADRPEIDPCDVNIDRLMDLPEEPGVM